jgi:hypothetical protein
MDWENFQSHGQASTRAFEAFTGILFERWIHRRRATKLDRVIFINGAGGDGGVESLAFYSDGAKRGLQAKWFRRALEMSELNQIRESIKTAFAVHPTLVEYIVAVPRDLAHPKRKRKDVEAERNTERDKWDALVQEFAISAPDRTLTLWDDGRFDELLGEVGSDGFIDYWFARTVIRFDDLQLVFEQARSGWLLTRYTPDFHTAGEIEADLSARVNGLRLNSEVAREFAAVESQLLRAAREVKRLCRFSFFVAMLNGEALVNNSLAAIDSALAEQRWLSAALQEGSAVARAAPSPASLEGPLTDLLEAIPAQKNLGIDCAEDVRSALDSCVRKWSERLLTSGRVTDLRRPVVYLGEPGSGKTHAMAHMVDQQLSHGLPALIVRARDLDACDGFEKLLRNAAGEPTWNQEDILDAFESSAVLVHVREISGLSPRDTTPPTRFLLAFDGLDESSNPDQWSTRLGEVGPLAARWPHVCFAFSMRPSLRRQLGALNGFSTLNVHKSDAALATIFLEYTSRSRISCPPVLRWALRTPLAIRLFAELYEDQRVDFSTSSFTLEALIDKKLQRVETSLREIAPEPWDPQLQPVQRALLGFVTEYIRRPRPLTSAEATKAAMNEQEGFGSLTVTTVGWILEQLRDYGLLLVSTSREKSFGPHSRTWEPAFEALTDFLLAHEAKTQIEAGNTTSTIPPFLRLRPDAATVTIAMLGAAGFDLLASGLWNSDLSSNDREGLQRVALLHAPRHETGEGWARGQFTRSMPACRQLLADLIIPSLRLPDRGYGGRFVHDILVGLTVQSRDQFWSVPYWLPRNHGAAWEGAGPDLDQLLELAGDDAWDGMPVVAAWALTSCNNDLRRLTRRRLAVWAADKPEQLLKLLEHAGRTNDPQMLEDLLWVTHGAAYLSSETNWNGVCDWLVESAAALHAVSRWNVEIAHTRRATVEFFRQKGLYHRELHDIPTDQTLLPLDLEAAKAKHRPMMVGAFDWDHIAYVIPKAYEPFFIKPLRLRHQSQAQNGRSGIEALPGKGLRALLDGDIRHDATDHNRKAASDELRRRKRISDTREKQETERREEILTLVRWFAGLPKGKQDEARKSFAKKGMLLNFFDRTVEVFGKEAGVPPEVVAHHAVHSATVAAAATDSFTLAAGSTKGPPELEAAIAEGDALLRAHAASINFSSLTAEQFALGYCQFRVLELGWDRSIHYKDPRGEKPGEVLGLDIAILRRHPQARHGERSTVSTMAEKYCWIARHELAGYLARRLSAECDDVLIPPPVDPAQFVETPSPATDHMRPCGDLQWPLDLFRTLAPARPDIAESMQIKMANEWVATTPAPTADSFLRASGDCVPVELRPYEWVVLHAIAQREDAETMGESHLWTCAFAVTHSDVPLIIEDAQAGLVDRLHEIHSGLSKIEFYTDPSEVVWAPWFREIYNVRKHHSVDWSGSPCEIPLRALSCRFHWKHEEQEEELPMPSRWLLERMKVTHVKHGRFCRSDNTVVAVLDSERILLARADLVTEVLKTEGMNLCWGVRIYREPNTLLRSESEQFSEWNWYGVVVYSHSALESHTIACGLEDGQQVRHGHVKAVQVRAPASLVDDPSARDDDTASPNAIGTDNTPKKQTQTQRRAKAGTTIQVKPKHKSGSSAAPKVEPKPGRRVGKSKASTKAKSRNSTKAKPAAEQTRRPGPRSKRWARS